MGIKWRAWMSRAGRHWNATFRRCERRDCSRVGKLWGRIAYRRGICLHESWYCSAQCFESAMREHFVRARLPLHAPSPTHHRIPLGLLMLSRGQLTDSQLRTALEAQRTHGRGRLGHWMEQLGFATEAQITASLGLQWGCPVLPAFESDPRCAAMVPFHLQQIFRMLPVQFVESTRILHVAFAENIGYTALYAIEQILRCRTEPCLLARGTMDRALERISREHRTGEILFEGWRGEAEMAHITCSYALKLESCRVRLAACGDYVWVRLESSQDATSLLLRRPNPAIASGAEVAEHSLQLDASGARR